MHCHEAQDLILETLRPNEHSVECPSCTEFLKEQQSLDAVLRRTIAAPEPGSQFSSQLASRIHNEPQRLWPEWLPDALHFGACAAVTAVFTLVLPFPPLTVLTACGGVTVAGYLAQLAVREIIDL